MAAFTHTAFLRPGSPQSLPLANTAEPPPGGKDRHSSASPFHHGTACSNLGLYLHLRHLPEGGTYQYELVAVPVVIGYGVRPLWAYHRTKENQPPGRVLALRCSRTT
jgi:hypothetical protein